MQTFKVLLLCGVVLSMGGCKSLRSPKESVVIHDTLKVETEITYHDTVFVTPEASVTYTFHLPEGFKDHFKPVLKTNKNAKLTASVQNDSLVMGCYCDTVAIKAQFKNTVTKEYRSKNKEVTKPPVYIQYIPPWVKVLAWIGGAWVVFVIIYLILRFYKPG